MTDADNKTTAERKIAEAISYLRSVFQLARVDDFAIVLSPQSLAHLRAAMTAEYMIADPSYVGREDTICGVPIRSERT